MDPVPKDQVRNGMMSGNAVDTRHVEVSICDHGTGSTVTGASVTIASSGHVAQAMPVAEMRGFDQPTTETHYGNNVPRTSGTSQVSFTLKGQTGTFTIKR